MFKLQSPSKESPFYAICLSICVFHCSKQFLHIILMSFITSDFFLSFLPLSLWPLGIFSLEQTKRVARGEIEWIGRVGLGGHAALSKKLLKTQCSVGKWAHKLPIMKWPNALKESKKKNPKTLKPNADPHNNSSSTLIHLVEEACITRGLPSRR